MICDAPTQQGSTAGYYRHRRNNEPPCASCKQAYSDYLKQYRAANRKKIAEQKRAYRESNWEKIIEYQGAWREANASLINARNRRRYAADGERERERNRRYREANPETRRQTTRRWKRGNLEKQREYEARRRARKASALTVPFTQEQLAQRMAFWGNRCWMCGGPFEHVDHVIALARGGPHCLSNLRPACVSCNTSKNARDWRAVVPLDLHDKVRDALKEMAP